MASLVSIVENALVSVASALPDAVREMCHGTETGNAIKSSSVELTGEAATESGAVEKSRVTVTASEFPTLGADSVVTIGDEPYIVTFVKTDPISASMTVGISEPLSKYPARVIGVRGQRSITLPIDILAENNGLVADVTDGFAPTTVHSWTIVVSVNDWAVDAPRIGDEIQFTRDGEDLRVKVARCNRRENHFVISARSR